MNTFARSSLPVLNVLGHVVLMFAATLLVPLVFAVIGDDGAQRAFHIAVAVTAGSGLALTLATRRFRRDLQARDGFLLVTLVWTVFRHRNHAASFGCPICLYGCVLRSDVGSDGSGGTVFRALPSCAGVNIWRQVRCL